MNKSIRSLAKRLLGTVMKSKTVKYRGYTFKGSFQDFGFLNSLAVDDREPLMADIFLKSISETSVVFDIGAHLGQYSILAASKAKSNRSVFAFEIHSRTFDYLKQNIHVNGFDEIIVPLYKAFSDSPGKISVNIDMQQSDFTSITQVRTGASLSKIEIDAVTFESLIDIPKPDVIKIDVEGAESKVLDGLNSVFKDAEDLPTLFIESNSESLENSGIDAAHLALKLKK
jgi:FkbM family methyltransferase